VSAPAPAVVSLGETMGLIAPDPPVPLQGASALVLSHAGAESNVALGLARLGTPAAFCSRVGDDPFGRRIVADLTRAGVDASGVLVVPGARTGVMFKDPGPVATAVHYYRDGSAAAGMDGTDAGRALATGARLIHLTGITPTLSPTCAAAVDSAIEAARERGVHVSFDVNFRPALWPAPSAAATELLGFAQRCDAVLVGLDEAMALWGVTTADDVRALVDAPSTLVVKDGPRPVTAYADRARTVVPALAVDVVEPVGAGDAFAAGWWHARLAGAPVPDAVECGHRCAAAVLVSGTDDPAPTRGAV
jgi:2-dehydro-3-deoxygluconokinase